MIRDKTLRVSNGIALDGTGATSIDKTEAHLKLT